MSPTAEVQATWLNQVPWQPSSFPQILYLKLELLMLREEKKLWMKFGSSLSACCCCSVAKSYLFVTSWTAACQAPLSSTISESLLKLISIELVMSSNHLILCYSLLLLPSIFPRVKVFSSESVLCLRWPKYWRFSFSISPSNEYSGLISFRMDWFDLRAVQGSLKSFSNTTLWKHHSSALSFLYSPTLTSIHELLKKTIALTRWTFVGKVMSLLFNMLSRLVITFLPRSKGLLISWLQSPSAVILEPKKTKSLTVSIVFPSICHEVMGTDAMIFTFWTLALSQIFHFLLSLSSKGSFSSSCFLPLEWCHLHIWGYCYFSHQSWF